MSTLSDEELMWSVSKGNLNDMAILFERYHKRIYNFYLPMVKDAVLSEDLTQNVFYKVIKYKHSYKGGKFASWIFQVARNLVYDHWQQKQKKQSDLDLDNLAEPVQENSTNTNEEVAHLYKVLDRLDLKEKELIIMSKIQGMQYADMAEIMETSPGAIKVKVHRVLKKLKQQYFETV